MQDQFYENLHQQLKSETAEIHKKAQKTEYIRQLMQDNIPPESYINHLRCLSIIYAAVEKQIETLDNSEIQHCIQNYIPKLPYLLTDLDNMNAEHIKTIIPATRNALNSADKIITYGASNPYKLLGYLYVLDGSLNGGSQIKKHINRSLQTGEKNLTSYLSLHKKNTETFWNNFIVRLNKITDSETQKIIIESALECFYAVVKIFEKLYPIKEKLQDIHISSLNPEAGDHPLPKNPKEISAAKKAALKIWEKFPYFKIRYGERGKRFGISDSAWLATLYELPEEMALEQTEWIAAYLAHKGMPTITIEAQVHRLYKELKKAIPEKKEKYKILKRIANTLKSKRYDILPKSGFKQADILFLQAYKTESAETKVFSELKKNGGKLIASAICDAKNGIPESKNNLKDWLCNSEIFSKPEIQAAQTAFSEIEKLFINTENTA